MTEYQTCIHASESRSLDITILEIADSLLSGANHASDYNLRPYMALVAGRLLEVAGEIRSHATERF